NAAKPQFAFTGSVPGGAFECRLGEAPFAACSSLLTAGPLADGDYTFDVRALDGDVADPILDHFVFIVDTVAPATSIVAAPGAVTRSRTGTFELRASEPDATLECRLGGDFAPCPAHVERGPLADGDYTFEARAVDCAGNADPTLAVQCFRV